MFNIFILALLLLYFLYFYVDYRGGVEKPAGAPSKSSINPSLLPQGKRKFRFVKNGVVEFEHLLPDHSYMLHASKIVPRDACYLFPNSVKIAAKGRELYEYLKNNPELKYLWPFQENAKFTIQRGDVFYFNCQNYKVKNLGICPSGTLFQTGNCRPINSCTDKPNLTKLVHSKLTQYVVCQNGREVLKNCPNDQFFYVDRCIEKSHLIHYCKFYDDKTFVLDATTKLECLNGKPHFFKCPPNTRFFDKDYCEPNDCEGHPDHHLLPQAPRHVEPFRFVPGYKKCLGGKIAEEWECPHDWDDTLTEEDNLTSLPMVFNGKKCDIPKFCENVFSDDPDVIVPAHQFTKFVRNWKLSSFLDSTVGTACSGMQRKRVLLEPGTQISKKFKKEDACLPGVNFLPILHDPNQYYDCLQRSVHNCAAREYFDGETCKPEPKFPVTFMNFPMFSFDSLSLENWILPWEYSKDPLRTCSGEESEYIPLYNVCSHPDCKQFDFLSMIPDLALLLPEPHQSKCRFEQGVIKKERVGIQYRFWDQKLLKEGTPQGPETCTPGQNLKTGNFIWDRSIFATCDPKEPFIFCPVYHAPGIILTGKHYACAPPPSNTFQLNTGNWVPFRVNEVKRVVPSTWDGNLQLIKKNKKDGFVSLPQDGLEIMINERLNLLVGKPVNIELRYRVTHPPNVAFHYDQNNQLVVRDATSNQGFIVGKESFTKLAVNFPTYKVEKHVAFFENEHN